MDATIGAGTTFLSWAPDVTSVFRVVQSLVFCVLCFIDH